MFAVPCVCACPFEWGEFGERVEFFCEVVGGPPGECVWVDFLWGCSWFDGVVREEHLSAFGISCLCDAEVVAGSFLGVLP